MYMSMEMSNSGVSLYACLYISVCLSLSDSGCVSVSGGAYEASTSPTKWVLDLALPELALPPLLSCCLSPSYPTPVRYPPSPVPQCPHLPRVSAQHLASLPHHLALPAPLGQCESVMPTSQPEVGRSCYQALCGQSGRDEHGQPCL